MTFKKKVVSFLSAPGGVGKTTLAITLSLFLNMDGKKSLLIDLDPSYGLSLRVLPFSRYQDKVRIGHTIDRLLKKHKEGELSRDNYKDFVTEFQHRSGSIFHLIISTENLSEVIDTIWYGSEAGREYLIRDLITSLKLYEDWDLVILDTIPFYEPKYSILAFLASDTCIIPLRPNIIDITRTINMLNTLKRKLRRIIQDEKEMMSRVVMLFNMVWKRRKSEQRIPNYIQKVKNEISPHIHFLNSYIYDREPFRRILTREEESRDLNEIQAVFDNVYKEILKFLIRETIF